MIFGDAYEDALLDEVSLPSHLGPKFIVVGVGRVEVVDVGLQLVGVGLEKLPESLLSNYFLEVRVVRRVEVSDVRILFVEVEINLG